MVTRAHPATKPPKGNIYRKTHTEINSRKRWKTSTREQTEAGLQKEEASASQRKLARRDAVTRLVRTNGLKLSFQSEPPKHNNETEEDPSGSQNRHARSVSMLVCGGLDPDVCGRVSAQRSPSLSGFGKVHEDPLTRKRRQAGSEPPWALEGEGLGSPGGGRGLRCCGRTGSSGGGTAAVSRAAAGRPSDRSGCCPGSRPLEVRGQRSAQRLRSVTRLFLPPPQGCRLQRCQLGGRGLQAHWCSPAAAPVPA